MSKYKKILMTAFFIVRFKFQKSKMTFRLRSALKFVSRTIPQSGGYNTPQLAAKLFPKLALGFIPVIFAILFSNGYAAPSADVNKNGWKFLTFGMSAEQTDNLLLQNAMNALDFKSFAYRYYTINYLAGYFQSDNIKVGLSGCEADGGNCIKFYFIDNKLVAVQVPIGNQDRAVVMEQLKQIYTDGDIQNNRYGPKYFFYYDDNIIVYNDTRDVRYVCKEVVKMENVRAAIERKEEEKKQENISREYSLKKPGKKKKIKRAKRH